MKMIKKQSRDRAFANISLRMKKVLPRPLVLLVKHIGSEAAKSGFPAFLVGGAVRDILLGVSTVDIDAVIEGDAIKLARRLNARLKGTLVEHKRFGTATVYIDWPSGLKRPEGHGPKLKIDLATARKETYSAPAALPDVQFSSIREDLRRRDFTINAMAVSIMPDDFGQFVDFFGGMDDLKKGVIRVLHEGSFIDDPTRIFRAVRFEQRFSFRIDRDTGRLIRHAVKKDMFKKTDSQRIRDEIVLILKEPRPLKALRRMRGLDELRFIHEKIKLTPDVEKLFKACLVSYIWYNDKYKRKEGPELYLMYLMALTDRLGVSDAEKMMREFAFSGYDRDRLLSYKKNSGLAKAVLNRNGRVAPSEIYRVLKPLSREALMMIRSGAGRYGARRRISEFLDRYDGGRPDLNGHDLIKAGIAEGPRIRKVLELIRDAKLDGAIRTRNDELDFLNKCL